MHAKLLHMPVADGTPPGVGQPGVDLLAGSDPELEAALKAVLQVIYKDHPLQGNQILTLAAHLQRIGVHRLVEEHLRKFQQRTEG